MKIPHDSGFNKMKKYLILSFMIVFVVTSWAEARIYLDINAPSFVQIPILFAKWKSLDKTPSSFSEKAYEILPTISPSLVFSKVMNYKNLPFPRKEGIPRRPPTRMALSGRNLWRRTL
jgi:hypothetical protein